MSKPVDGFLKPSQWNLFMKEVSLMTGSKEIHKGDVKACTWLFETQPLDTIKDDSEATVKLQTVKQEEIHGRGCSYNMLPF